MCTSAQTDERGDFIELKEVVLCHFAQETAAQGSVFHLLLL